MTKTKHELRVISPELFFSEEQRPNIHIIGSSRQGKSRFMEWLMRTDIDRGIGCCLLDPTAGGETAYRMLAYCAEKKRDKVLFIDPAHADYPRKKVVGLQPFRYTKDGKPSDKLRNLSVKTLMNAIRSLYNVKDPSEQGRVERYLPAVFTALYDAKRPLVDARYFSNKLYVNAQEEILEKTDLDTRMNIWEAFTNPMIYQNFQSTVNRLLRFYRGTVGKMFSAQEGVKWMKVIREGWAVIVNLDNLDFFDARLLGTYILAELETAKKRLNHTMDEVRDIQNRGTYPPYYLYADEAYLFASQSLKNMLDLNQKMNFKLTLAHHTAEQFDDPAVYASIKQNCDILAQFYVRDRGHRDEIAGEMYGGEINPKDASYANANLPKQYAVIKIGKDNPVRERIPDVPAPNITKEDLNQYLSDVYQHDWYHDADKITPLQANAPKPGRTQARNNPRSVSSSPSNRKSNRSPRVSDKRGQTGKWKNVSPDVPISDEHAGTDEPEDPPSTPPHGETPGF